MKKILVLLTNVPSLANGEKNGTYSPELTHAVHVFDDAGYTYDFASIKGGEAPIYGENDNPDDQVNADVLARDDFRTRLNNTLPTSQVNFEDYDAVFYPGGFGLLYDLAEDETVGAKTGRFLEKGGVVGAVCHGPAGFLPVKYSDGRSMLEGLTVTGFTREEEIDYGTIDKIPFLLEEALTRKATRFEKVQPWIENVIVQDNIISGQNPGSAGGVGKAMVKALS
ncbi:type 1 glutamine amidotransferase domain-containing protein [Flexibacterium corallicola]|uniref:type 1 glutamine amidotransferase domain-containing protein n=1 Tax=Flexibacterium corallicola TaxID=3037259 RepID=UPI00286ED89D|nr:type 1 glutamine amidotransferase domain-containing protein [Pseudovibrio sp. M1P-2-3]